MLTSMEESKLDSLSQAFRVTLQERLPALQVVEAFTDRLVVTIPPKHPATGEMVIRLDGDEVTISVGSLFHCHFPVDSDENPQSDSERRAASRAVQFIADTLSDAIAIRLRHENGHIVAAEALPAAGSGPPLPNERDYLWSGPR